MFSCHLKPPEVLMDTRAVVQPSVVVSHFEKQARKIYPRLHQEISLSSSPAFLLSMQQVHV